MHYNPEWLHRQCIDLVYQYMRVHAMVAENLTFQECSWKEEKLMNRMNQHKEPIEGITVWLLIGYPSNILGYLSKYWKYTSKTKLGRFPISPGPPPQWITFLPISQKKLLNINDVEFDFRMGCTLVLFPFLWIINMQFTYFGFLNFLFSNIAILAYFDPKLTFLSLKFL